MHLAICTQQQQSPTLPSGRAVTGRHYEREIAAYDIKTQRCDVYGEDKHYRERVMLIYDGLHYDALSIAAFQDAPEEIDVSVFDPRGPQGPPAHEGAQELVAKVLCLSDSSALTLEAAK